MLFDLYDKDENGEIDFSEFTSATNIKTNGVLSQKLEWAFDFYDIGILFF